MEEEDLTIIFALTVIDLSETVHDMDDFDEENDTALGLTEEVWDTIVR